MARRYEEREEVIKSSVAISVTCNNCGKSKERDFEGDYIDYEEELWDGEYQSFYIAWGYMSKYDTEEWKFDLCQKCIEEIVSKFKIPIEKSHY